MTRRLGRLLALTLVLFAGPAAVAHAAVSAEISGGLVQHAGQVTSDPLQAGDHPSISLKIKTSGDENLKDLDLTLPPGLVGDPNAVTLCAADKLKLNQCTSASQVGETQVKAVASIPETDLVGALLAGLVKGILGKNEIPINANGKVFALTPRGGEPALLGIRIVPILDLCQILHDIPGSDIPLDFCHGLIPPQDLEDAAITLEAKIKVDSPGDFALTTALSDIPTQADLGGFKLNQKINEMTFTLLGTPPDGNGKPFVTAPTSCGPKRVKLRGETYTGTTVTAQGPVFTIRGCENLPFNPGLTVTPGEMEAGQPVAQDVVSGITFPAPDNGLAQAHLKTAVFTMPVGASISASMAADGLSGCTDAQFAATSATPERCPANSSIGKVVFTSPLVGDVTGSLYLATPTADVPLRLFIYATAGDVTIKLRGKTLLDAKTGQITLVFDENPETPFTLFGLTFRGGPTGMLKAPDECRDDYKIVGTATPFSGQAGKQLEAGFKVTGCKAKTFTPTFTTGQTSTQAAGNTDLTTTIARKDSDERLAGMKISMPSGPLARLPGVKQCPVADARVGNCGIESQIGSVVAKAGTGPKALELGGPVYITEGTGTDLAGIAIVVPAAAGPIDLGTVAVMGRFVVRPDLGIDIVADEVPGIVGGIPLYLREMKLDLNKPGFTFNASSCAAQEWKAEMRGEGGGSSTLTSPYQATGCEATAFNPQMTAKITGDPKAPAFSTTITGADGEATMKSTKLTLPEAVGVNRINISKACARADYTAGTCAPSATVGSVKAYSSLLPLPATGNVTLVAAEGLPVLAMQLRGPLSFDLEVTNTVVNGRLQSTIDGVPDAPISRFELELAGNSLLQSSIPELCAATPTADGVFTSHAGQARTAQVPVETAAVCGSSVTPAVRATLTGIRKGKKPVLRVRISAKDGTLRSARVSLPSKLSATKRRGKISALSGAGDRKASVASRAVSFSAPKTGSKLLTLTLSGGALETKNLKAGQRVRIAVRTTQFGQSKARTINVVVRARR